ncbi:MAG TPA: helix-turn-helix domain-containing protein [Candidatus Kryptonia bacterium]|nr:helix-turn-helix domain-containing protein [Candidatus Kryptonia bacterium]
MKTTLEQIAHDGPPNLARRVRIVLARADGMALGPIAQSVGVHRDSVRRWIKRFCVRGLAGLQHGNAGKSRNVVFDAAVCAAIRRRASMAPAALGEPYTTWSLYKLRDHLVRHGVVRTISIERLRQLLNGGPYARDYWPDSARRAEPAPSASTTFAHAHHSPDHHWLDLLIDRVAEPGAATAVPSLRRSTGR